MNAVNETAISSEPETQQEVSEVEKIATEPQEHEQNNDTDVQPPEEETTPTAEDNFLEIKYFKENEMLSKTEAKNFAEIGRRFSDVKKQLERVAALKGQTIDELVNGLEAAQDEAHRQGLIEKFGDDEDTINKMMELYNINKQKTIDNAKANQKAAQEAEEQTVIDRLAQEFVEMKNGDFPELTEFKDLPEEVKRAAAEGLSLSHAYLKHMHNENKKIAAEKASQEAAAKKSTGSMASDEPTDFVGDAFLRGILGKN